MKTISKDGILMMHSSQLTAFYECPRKWFFNFMLGRCKLPSEAMRKGSCFHKLGEFYFGDGTPLDDLVDRMHEEASVYADQLHIALPAFIAYLARWKDDMNIAIIDGTPAVEQAFEMQLTDYFVLKGRLDYIRSISSGNYICDWKFTGQYLSDWYFNPFEMSCQTMLYSFVGEQLYDNFKGFIIDAISCPKAQKTPKPKFERKFFPVLPNQEEFIAETIRTADFIIAHGEDEDAYEHRYTSCVGKYGKCQYFEVCRSAKRLQHELLAMDDFVDYKPLYSVGA